MDLALGQGPPTKFSRSTTGKVQLQETEILEQWGISQDMLTGRDESVIDRW